MNKKVITAISIDAKTISLLDLFAKEHSISRSSAICFIVNEYLLRFDEEISKRQLIRLIYTKYVKDDVKE
jgi:hypothetical protein